MRTCTCVIGGAGLLGRAIGAALLREGEPVLVADKDVEAARSFINGELKQRNIRQDDTAFAAQVDIGSKESLIALTTFAEESNIPINAVVNCAYPRNAEYGRRFEDVSYESFCENVGLHLGGYFLTMQTFAEYFARRGGGSILNVASVYGVVAPRFEIYADTEMTMPVEYAAIKSAIIHLTRYAARYYSGKNVRINSMCPGGLSNNQDGRFMTAYRNKCLNKGMLDPADVAGTAVFLLSEASRFINGQNIIVDDGFVL